MSQQVLVTRVSNIADNPRLVKKLRDLKEKIRRTALLDQILVDASYSAESYVQNYNAGRGAE